MATIVIDPGHYGSYNAGVCPGYYEGNTMLILAKHLGAALQNMGATVKYTRTTNEENPTLQQRGELAANADLFISLHSDASDIPTASGVTAYYSVRQPQTKPFAIQIGEAAAKAMGNSFREAYARESQTTPGYDYLGVLRSAVAAGAKNAFLIEHGFHTNMKDCLTLSDDAALRRIAAAEAEVIGNYFNLSAPSVPGTPQPGSCQFQYTVQSGESLYSIGQKLGVSWQLIASTNNITSPYMISSGQILTIPASRAVSNYTVRPGDSLYSISREFNVSWQAIASANNISSPYTLYPGQQLLIPQACYLHYTVQRQDTLSLIGARLGIPWEDIAAANQLYYPYMIIPGQKLIIPLPY